MINRYGRRHFRRNVSVSGQNHRRTTRLRIHSHEVAQVFVLHVAERIRLNARICRASQVTRRYQLVRNRLKNAVGKIELSLRQITPLHVFHCPARVGRHLHRESALVIVREAVKRQPHLPQIVDTLNLLRPHLAPVQHRQQHRSEDHDDGNDHEQLNQCKR
jgi:hypothetical protein